MITADRTIDRLIRRWNQDIKDRRCSSRDEGIATMRQFAGTRLGQPPNGFCQREKSRSETGGKYEIPGPVLLPWERLEGARYDGFMGGSPVDREHIIEIVSNNALIPDDLAKATDDKAPFRQLDQRAFAACAGESRNCETTNGGSQNRRSTWCHVTDPVEHDPNNTSRTRCERRPRALLVAATDQVGGRTP